ncbi:putative oxidoreductase (plasmid) [Mycolicibacterium madagascariense]|uniref:Putative oxidoreductase n=1 Tax=Mycolicibacterium madagascariense TaxID=212765 RepID=A0A7I7XPT8_9MYCO|nr:nitroreductase family protein [Mycolicibacterium madagascariense]BBZ31230.1 putative oxidoreductase [Mycolicibacterium madagascariense]
MEVDELLTTTRSARKTLDLDAAVDVDDIRTCLRIGMQAPSGSNHQAWRWVVVSDVEIRREPAELYRRHHDRLQGRRLAGHDAASSPDDRVGSSAGWLARHLARVPLLVIPCYETVPLVAEGHDAFTQATLYGSIFPAVWNFQLALRSRGYGSCITTIHLLDEPAVRSLLDIPDTVTQGCLLPVARLRSRRPARPGPRRPLSEVVSVDSWRGPPL